MEYATERRLEDIAPLLERLDRGETLSEDEQTELAAIRVLSLVAWKGSIPKAVWKMNNLEILGMIATNINDLLWSQRKLHRDRYQ